MLSVESARVKTELFWKKSDWKRARGMKRDRKVACSTIDVTW